MIVAYSHLTPAQRREALRIAKYEKPKPELYWRTHEQIDAAIVSSVTGLVRDVLYYKEFLP